jgi:hypothetical protein
MDRFVANTLRTFGLIIMAIAVIAISLGLVLLGFCFTVLTSVDRHGGASTPPNYALHLGIVAAVAFLIFGIFAIGAIARVIFRESKIHDRSDNLPPLPPYSLVPPSPQVPAQPHPVVPSPAPPAPSPTDVPPSTARSLTTPLTTTPRRPALDAATHLSPGSRLAIDRLILAIAAQASAQLIVGVIEWLWSAQIPMQGFRLHGPLLLVWNVAALLPYVLLVIAMRRRPGATALSFCLVIPGIRSFFGFFGQTASIIVFLRTFHSGMPMLSAIPWALDVLIFYLAWKAVRLTGIEPTPGRLILSAIDICLYSFSLPVVFLVLNYFWR